MITSLDSYRADLAYIHDTGHGDFARNAVPGLIDILRRSGMSSGLVVDLGCGSGIWAGELVKAGYDVLGIDLSNDILDIARERVPEAEFRRGSLFDVPLPECVAVTSIGECMNYLFDEQSGKEGLMKVFARIYEALQPGGMFIFDVIGPGRERGMPQKRWRQGEDWATLVDVEEYSDHTLTRKITSFRRVGDMYRKDEEVHKLRLYNSADIAEWLRSTGFTVRVMRGYGAMRFTQAHAAFAARKPL